MAQQERRLTSHRVLPNKTLTFINLRDITSAKQEQWYLAKYHLVSTKVYNYYSLDFQEYYICLAYVNYFFIRH